MGILGYWSNWRCSYIVCGTRKSNCELLSVSGRVHNIYCPSFDTRALSFANQPIKCVRGVCSIYSKFKPRRCIDVCVNCSSPPSGLHPSSRCSLSAAAGRRSVAECASTSTTCCVYAAARRRSIIQIDVIFCRNCCCNIIAGLFRLPTENEHCSSLLIASVKMSVHFCWNLDR